MPTKSPFLRIVLLVLVLTAICGGSLTAAPAVGSVTAAQDDTDGSGTLSIFSGVTVTNGGNVDVTITFDTVTYGRFAESTDDDFTYNAGNRRYTLDDATPAAAQTAIRGLQFDPIPNIIPINSTQDVVVTLEVADEGGGGSTTETVTITITPENAAPTLTNVATTLAVDDDDTTQTPFSGATVADVDNSGAQPVNVEITVTPIAAGTLSGTNLGLKAGTSNVYTFSSNLTPSALQSALRAITLRPVENRVAPRQTESISLAAKVLDDATTPAESATRTIAVTVTSINDIPVLGGISNTATDDNASVAAFASATITDPDASEQVTVTITLDDEDKGELTPLTSFSRSGAVYTLANVTPAAAQTALRALSFSPDKDRLPVGLTEDVDYTIVVSDGTNATSGNADGSDTGTASTTVTSVNDKPVVTGTSDGGDGNGQPTATGSTTFPFSGVSISDPDTEGTSLADAEPQAVTVVVTLNEDFGSIVPSGGFVETGTRQYTLEAASAVAATSAIRALEYSPPVEAIPQGSSETVTFDLSATDEKNSAADTPTPQTKLLITTPLNSASIIGTVSNQTTNDKTSIQPFSEVIIDDPNPEDPTLTFTVTIKLVNPSATGTDDGDTHGELVNLGDFVKQLDTAANDFEYVYNPTGGGRAELATDQIRQMSFIPAENLVPSTRTTQFQIIVNEGNAATEGIDTATTVITTTVNDLPTIVGAGALPTISDKATTQPFANVSIADPDQLGGQDIDVYVYFTDPAQGVFTADSLTSSGFELDGSGQFYKLAADDPGIDPLTSAEATTAIRQLVFDPAENRLQVGGNEVVRFTIAVFDGTEITEIFSNEFSSSENNKATLTVTSLNDRPALDNVPASPVVAAVDASNQIKPFDGITLTDPDLAGEGNPQPIAFTITIDDTSKGTFSGSSNLSQSGNTFRLQNPTTGVNLSAAQITTDLSNLIFTLDPTFPIATGEVGIPVVMVLSALDTAGALDTETITYVFRPNRQTHIVTTTDDDATTPPVGSLRKAVADAGNNDIIVFALEEYPATIRLEEKIVVDKTLTISGVGANLLTISGDPDPAVDGDNHQILQIGDAEDDGSFTSVTVSIEGITFTEGVSPNDATDPSNGAGGAIGVLPGSSLSVLNSAFIGNTASQWGGAIDVNQGSISAINSLFYGNTVTSLVGQGGGAVSVFSDQDSEFVNCTFTANTQQATSGFGGGALILDNSNIGTAFDVNIDHCTFVDNFDEAGQGSAIRVNSADVNALVRNAIVTGDPDGNLSVQAGRIISLGGNIADGTTEETFSQGGEPQLLTLFDESSDRIETDPLLGDLADNGGPTLTHALLAGSPAINGAVFESTPPNERDVAFDQRGRIRPVDEPDSGAFERNALQQLVINEINFDPATGNDSDEFIEIYNLRSSAAVDIQNFTVKVNGQAVHTFASSLSVPVGGGVVLAPNASTLTTLEDPDSDAEVPVVKASAGLGLDDFSGIVTLEDSRGLIVAAASYNAGFTEVTSPPAPAAFAAISAGDLNQSVTRLPEYFGVFVPLQWAFELQNGTTTTSTSTPGRDVTSVPFFGGNAPPVARDDDEGIATDEDTTIELDLTLNDVELDGVDELFITEINRNALAGAITLSVQPDLDGMGEFDHATGTLTGTGSGAEVFSNNDGSTIVYNPTPSSTLRALAVGETYDEVFEYTILDKNTDTDTFNSRGADAGEIALNTVLARGLVKLTVSGVNDAPIAVNDSRTTDEDTPETFPTSAVLTNDFDYDNEELSAPNRETDTLVVIGTDEMSPVGATITFDDAANTITYDPSTSEFLNRLGRDQTYVDTFNYTIEDIHGATDTATISFTVTGVNDRPVASNDTDVTNEDTVLTIPTSELLANDLDIDFVVDPVDAVDAFLTPPTDTIDERADTETSVLTVVRAASSGDGQTSNGLSALGAIVSLSGGEITYDPRASSRLNQLSVEERIEDTFIYAISDTIDGRELEHTAIVTVTVIGINDQATANLDEEEVNEDGILTVLGRGVLANDTDPDVDSNDPDDRLLVRAHDTLSARGATITIQANGDYTYDPSTIVGFGNLSQDEELDDTFSYLATDDSLTIGSEDRFTVAQNALAVSLDVLGNDTILNSDPAGTNTTVVGFAEDLTVTEIDTTGTLGTVQIEDFGISGNSISYLPQPNYTGTDTFGYTISDSVGGSFTRTVVVSVVNDTSAPVFAADDYFTVGQNSLDNPINVLLNDDALPNTATGFTVTGIQDISAGGVATIDTDNRTVLYSPANGYFGRETFTYTAENASGDSINAEVEVLIVKLGTDTIEGSVEITVLGVNDKPNAVDDIYADAVEGMVLSKNQANGLIDSNDTDPDRNGSAPDDVLTVVAASTDTTSAAGATLTINPDGSFDYDPRPSATIEALGLGETLDDTFSYTITDDPVSGPLTDSALVTITVTGINDIPVANDDTYTANEDDPLAVAVDSGVSSNDTDVDTTDVLIVNPTAVNGSTAAGAELTLNADGSLTYVPSASATLNALSVGEAFSDTFTYTIDDQNGGTNNATITFEITGVNDAPTANADTGATLETDALVVASPGLLDNDTDPDQDGNAPDDVLLIDTGNSETVSALGASITYDGDQAGGYTYDPSVSAILNALSAGEVVVDTFTYQITDQNGGTSSNTVSITVTGVNDDPTGNDDTGATDEDTLLTVDVAASVLLNDTDPDQDGNAPDDVLIVSAFDATSAEGATVVVNSDGSFTYDPTTSTSLNALAVGEPKDDTFSYTVDDQNGGTDTATVTITVTGVNDGPTANDDTYAVNEDTLLDLSVAANALIGNDTDPDQDGNDPDDVLTISNFDDLSAEGARVFANLDGTFTYDPRTSSSLNALPEGETFDDTFTYEIDDGHGSLATATVTITITGVNDLPEPGTDTYGTDEDTILEVDAAGVLTNDTDDDIDGNAPDDALSVASADTVSTAGAAVTVNVDGSLSYDPTAAGTLQQLAVDQPFTDSFSYVVGDTAGGQVSGTVFVNVTGVNDAPITNDESYTVAENAFIDSANDGSVDGLLANDDDIDNGDTLDVISFEGTTTNGAIVVVNIDGDFTYDPRDASAFISLAAGDSLVDTFTYTVSDAQGATRTGTATVTVTGVNEPPQASDDAYTANEGEVLTVNEPTGVLANDSDPNSDTITATPIANGFTAQGATLNLDADGSITYDPSTSASVAALGVGQTLVDTFTYTISDGLGGTDTATVSITVSGANDAPGNILLYSSISGFNSQISTVLANLGHTVTSRSSLPTDLSTYDSVWVLGFSLSASDRTRLADYVNTGKGLFLAGEGTDVALFNDFVESAEVLLDVLIGTGVVDLQTTEANEASFSFNTSALNGITTTPNTLNATAFGQIGLISGVSGDNVFITDGDGAAVAAVWNDDNMLSSSGRVAVVMDTDWYNGSDPARQNLIDNLQEFLKNTEPSPNNDAYNANEDTLLTIAAPGVLGNDTDPDDSNNSGGGGDTLIVADFDAMSAQGASVSMAADGSFTYDPRASTTLQSLGPLASAFDTFTYTLSDQNGGMAVATVTISVSGANDAPSPQNDSGFIASEGNILVVPASGVLANDFDIDSDDTVTITPTVLVSSLGGTVAVAADGGFSYNPTAIPAVEALGVSESTNDTFTYTVSDLRGVQATAVATIIVNGRNDVPSAVDDSGFETLNTVVFNGSGLLNNDSDVDANDTFVVTNFQSTSNLGATVSVAANGSFTYDPTTSTTLSDLAQNQELSDTFTYTIRDQGGSGSSDVATVTIVVKGSETFELWAAREFGNNAGNALIAGDNQDPNGDGLSNLVAYATDTSALDNTGEAITQVVEERGAGAGGEDIICFLYRRSKTAVGITYSVQSSANLVGWTPVAIDPVIHEELPTAYMMKVAIPEGTAGQFLRLTIQRNP